MNYTGRVQGVGFRYTAKRLADEHGVVGWVRNEDDGSVGMVAAGNSDQLKSFLDAIQDRLGSYIFRAVREKTEPSPHWKHFEIRR